MKKARILIIVTTALLPILAAKSNGSQFGTVSGKNVKLTLSDCDGNDVTFSLSGPGYGVMDGDDCSFSEIVLYDTSENSQLTISTKGKTQTSIGSIVCQGPLKSITAKTTDLRGDITINGSLGSITFDDIADGHTITIGSSDNPKAGVLMKFDQIKDLTINSDMPIKMLSATEWLDTDYTPDELNAPSVGSLIIKGNKSKGLEGDFEANLNLGNGVGANLTEPVLKSLKITGTLGGNLVVHGNLGTATINILLGLLDVEGDIKSLKINHALATTAYIDDSGELIIGGKANITAGKEKIKVQNGAVLYGSQDPNLYRLEDLRRYDQMGAWWAYQGDYYFSGLGMKQYDTINFTTQVENWTKLINGHECIVVTGSVAESEISTAWYTDAAGTHQAGWGIISAVGQFDFNIDSTVVAPEFLRLRTLYKSSGTVTGEFNGEDQYGEEITGDISGTISSTLKLAGHEEVSTWAGTFQAAKVDITATIKGTMNLEYLGESYTGKLAVTMKQTWWAVPEIGIVKVNTINFSEKITISGEGSASIKIQEIDELLAYGP